MLHSEHVRGAPAQAFSVFQERETHTETSKHWHFSGKHLYQAQETFHKNLNLVRGNLQSHPSGEYKHSLLLSSVLEWHFLHSSGFEEGTMERRAAWLALSPPNYLFQGNSKRHSFLIPQENNRRHLSRSKMFACLGNTAGGGMVILHACSKKLQISLQEAICRAGGGRGG